MSTPLLEMRGISKTFPGVRALDDVTFDLRAGEIHAVVGENGAGKSTLMKILSGVYADYEGTIWSAEATPPLSNGVLKSGGVASALHMRRAGVAIVFQELSLVPELTIAENVFLGREPTRFGVVQWNELDAQTSRLLRELGLDLDPRTPLRRLGTGQQQMVEIAKALSHDARILVLDEPTAALTDVEAEHLFGVLTRLRSKGIGIIYISHRLEEVFRISDRITVLRDGKSAGTDETRNLTADQVIARMVGREVSQLFPTPSRQPSDTALELRDVSAFDARGKAIVSHASFSVRRGEVLGIAGLMGAGRTALLSTIFGAWRGRVAGDIFLDGKAVRITRPSEAVAHGIALVTEDRKQAGLVLDQGIVPNMTLAALRRVAGRFVLDPWRELAASEPLAARLRIKAGSLLARARNLSGGNQQKVVLAKWLLCNPRVLLLDEPTRGVDVGAKQEIYALIEEWAAEGMAVVLVSSELPEVLGLADRIVVLHEGHVAGTLDRSNATPESVMALATGQGAAA